jgi:hemolysin activation/secretion protein
MALGASRVCSWSVVAAVSLVISTLPDGFGAAYAQIRPGLPPPPPPGSPLPGIVPTTPPPVSPGLQIIPQGNLPNIAPSTPIAITSVTIDGATVFPRAELEAAIADLVGPATPANRIEAARLALVRRYRDAGYPLVNVAVDVSDGHVHFIVSEGHITSVLLDGDIGPAGTQVLRFLDTLKDETPISAATIERELLLAQDVPGVSIQAVLKPDDTAGTTPGALTLIARVSRAPVSTLLTADNRAYQNTGPQESLASVNLNSFTSFGEQTQLQFYDAGTGSQIFGQGSIETFLGASGLKFKFYGGAGDSLPTGTLAAINYQGQTEIVGGQFSYPLIRSREQNLNLIGLFEAINSTIFTGASPSAIASKDSVRAFRFGVDYALLDLWLGAAMPATNTATIRLSQGINGFGATANSATDTANAFALPRFDFTKISGEVTREQTLFSPWAGSTMSLFGLVTGQGCGQVLPTIEQFYLGGSAYTRGYYSGEVTGDSALAWTTELRLNTGFPLTLFDTGLDVGLQTYGFYDGGETWNNSRLEPNHRLASLGVGARMNVTDHTEFDLEGVERLVLNPLGGVGVTTKLAPLAGYWRVVIKF